MNEHDATTAIARLADTIPDSPAPLANLVRDGEQARRRRRRRSIVGVGAAALVVVVSGVVVQQTVDTSSRGHSDVLQPSKHGGLSDREYSVAVEVARQEADKFADTVTSATATVGRGTAEGNLGQDCTSGTLLHITIIGTFHGLDVTGTPAGSPDFDPTPTALSITADPESGQACLLGVRTDDVTPDPDATVLVID